MPFVSYAQNREDAVLWRALAEYGPGFYIDVGAGDPVSESVTKAFSAAGWRGINVEPMPEPMDALREDRPRDVNLQVALEAEPGSRRYYNVKRASGLSTGVAEYATRYKDLGWEVDEIEVDVDTLANVCSRFVRDEIHFLKIDAEGSEEAILRGADFQRFRPWIVVVEALAPCVLMTSEGVPVDPPAQEPVATHDSWEGLLTAAGYQFVLFDGLNRFYVADEKADILTERLAAPANVLDDVVSAFELSVHDAERREARRIADEEIRRALAQADSLQAQYDALADEQKSTTEELLLTRDELDGAYQQLWELSRHISSVVARVHRRESELAALEGRAASAEGQCEAVTRELNAVISSRSYKATKLLRKARGLFRRKSSEG